MPENKISRHIRPVLFLETSEQVARTYYQWAKRPVVEALDQRQAAYEFIDPISSELDLRELLASRKYGSLVTQREHAPLVRPWFASREVRGYTRTIYWGSTGVDDIRAAIQCGAEAILEFGTQDHDVIAKVLLSSGPLKRDIYG